MSKNMTLDEHKATAHACRVLRAGLSGFANAIEDIYGRCKASEHAFAAIEHVDRVRAALEGKLSSESGDGKLGIEVYYGETVKERQRVV